MSDPTPNELILREEIEQLRAQLEGYEKRDTDRPPLSEETVLSFMLSVDELRIAVQTRNLQHDELMGEVKTLKDAFVTTMDQQTKQAADVEAALQAVAGLKIKCMSNHPPDPLLTLVPTAGE